MSESPPMDDLIPVMVPRRHLSTVYALLGRLADDIPAPIESSTVTRAEQAKEADPERSRWTVVDFQRLVADPRPSVERIVRVLDVLADRPGVKLSTTALSEATGLSRGELRGGFSGFTRVCNSFPGGAKRWPMTWSWGPAEISDLDTETFYTLPAIQAQSWKLARSR